ncbi:MAG: 16S rRNA (guanine(527)-N(7))-methyltransferase RsmG [Prevotellaceae bacterium]|nr:16S rRNA (guanine(527)-N(7))-methyltransferase RsmG [Prevotellaceae bacterium]
MAVEDTACFKEFFPALTEQQSAQLAQLAPLYAGWNARINVISRKDVAQINLHHVLHSLAIAKFIHFQPGASVLDAGTGGGFPGIPLAILFPGAHFTLADSTGKKITVVQAVADSLRLQNVTAVHARVETIARKFDFVVSRAVTALPAFVGWVWDKINAGGAHSLPNGIICLKGGDLADEIAGAVSRYSIAPAAVTVAPVSQWFPAAFFAGKKIVYIRR